MPFQPGQSGNPSGSAPKKIWVAALNRAIAQDDGKRLREAAEKLLDMAAQGDIAALRELGDRIDGKAIQAIQAEVDARVIVEMVKFADTNPG